MTAKTKIKKIELAWITVSDFEKSLEFFTHVVGLEVVNRDDTMGWAELRGKDGSFLGIAKSNSFNPVKPGANAIVTMTVENIDAARKEFQQKGAKLLGDVMEVPGHVKLQMFVDDDNNHFQLVETLDK